MRPGRHESEPPDFGDGALHVLQGMLVDPVVEDMRILGNINMFFAERNGARGSERREADGRRALDAADAQRYRTARGKPPYRLHPLHLHRAREARRDRPPRARGVQRPLRRPEGPALTGLPAAEPAARRREPDPRRAAQLPVLRPRVHRGADPHGPARRPPLAARRARARTTRGRSSRWTRSRARPQQPRARVVAGQGSEPDAR